jgi:hypothetical protein
MGAGTLAPNDGERSVRFHILEPFAVEAYIDVNIAAA